MFAKTIILVSLVVFLMVTLIQGDRTYYGLCGRSLAEKMAKTCDGNFYDGEGDAESRQSSNSDSSEGIGTQCCFNSCKCTDMAQYCQDVEKAEQYCATLS